MSKVTNFRKAIDDLANHALELGRQIKEKEAEIERLLTALTIAKWDSGLGPAALEALTSEDKIKIAERIERKHAERMKGDANG
jgi:hypothetical protein